MTVATDQLIRPHGGVLVDRTGDRPEGVDGLEVIRLSPRELAGIPNAVVVDVRSDEEYAAGHIDGALHIPLALLAERASAIPKDATVVTACGKGGGRSDRAALELRALGFTSARPLCGGTMAWLAQGERRG